MFNSIVGWEYPEGEREFFSLVSSFFPAFEVKNPVFWVDVKPWSLLLPTLIIMN
jgi:hypothetical protein